MKKLFTSVIVILLMLFIGSASSFALVPILPISIVPNAPSYLGQPSLSTPGPTSVMLTWSDNSNNETGFRIEAKQGLTWVTKATLTSNITKYNLTGLIAATQYTVRVIAFNDNGDSAPSNEYMFTTESQITITQPEGGTLTGGQAVTIKWTIKGDHSGFMGGDVPIYLYYNIDGSDYYPYIINHTTVMAGAGSYTWIVPNKSTSKLKIMAFFTKSGLGIPSTISDTTDSPITINLLVSFAPIKPSNLTAKTLSSSSIQLEWDQSGDKTGFKIFRQKGSEAYTQIATVDSNTYKLVDTNLSPGTTYNYKVYAYNNLTSSEASNTATATTQLIKIVTMPLFTILTAPKDLQGAVSGISQVDLVWTKGDNYATGYSLERKKGDGSFTEIADLGSDVTSYSDTGAIFGNTYQYRVRAYNSGGYTPYSNTITIDMPTLSIMPIIPELVEPIIPETEPEDDSTTDDYPAASEWAKDEIAKAVQYNLTTDEILSNFQNPITREEFCEIVVKLYEALSGKTAVAYSPNPFNDTSNTEILKAYRLGIVNGISTDTFAPNKNISRQEICVMLLRALKAVDPGADYSANGVGPFADDNQIAGWAKDAVMFMNHENIMNGVGGNKINPLGNTTREQAIALVLRTYEQFGL